MLIITCAWAFGRLGKKIGQPLAVGEIAAGILLGPSVMGLCGPWGTEVVAFMRDPELQRMMQVLGKVGLILLLFQVGMQFHFSDIGQRSRTVWWVASLGIVGPMLLGLMIGPWLHRNLAPEVPRAGMILFSGIAMAISALPIMGRILIELHLQSRSFALVAISAAALDDVLGWVLLASAGALASYWSKAHGFDPTGILIQIAGIAVLYLVMMKVVGPLMRRLYRNFAVPTDHLPHSFLAILLVVLFGSCLMTHHLGIFTIFGAFLLGVSLHQERQLVEAWTSRYASLVTVAFVPVFFTNNGLNVNLQSLSGLGWIGLVLVCFCSIFGKLGCCYLGARLGGESHLDAFRIGTLLNTRALMGLIAVSVGKSLGLFNDTMFTIFVLMCLITTAMCGPLLHASLSGERKKDCADQ